MSRKAKRRMIRRMKKTAVFFAAILMLLLLTFRVTAMTASAEDNEIPVYRYYTSVEIHQGDTLWSIAEQYYTDECGNFNKYISEIKNINGLSGDLIKVGNHLCVPYYSTEYLE